VREGGWLRKLDVLRSLKLGRVTCDIDFSDSLPFTYVDPGRGAVAGWSGVMSMRASTYAVSASLVR
jgi:hypothetical protein